LHQATESFLNFTLLVLTNYKPKSHDLEDLLKKCNSRSNQFLSIFPTKNKEQEECFKLLKRAYIDARYTKDYKITKDQLEYLIKRVEELKRITNQICKDRIDIFIK